ncbi:MAG: VanZ family protein [Deltaproteobacteria bacterium]|nr:VanZ family protein [Deltaproteobacteria bacterium]
MKPFTWWQRGSYWIPVLLYAGFIWYLSSGPVGAPRFPFADKLGHLAIYAGLGFLLLRALACTQGAITRPGILLAILLTTAYGMTDELHQLSVPQRTADPLDVCADLIGGALGAWAYFRLNWWLLQRLRRRQ